MGCISLLVRVHVRWGHVGRWRWFLVDKGAMRESNEGARRGGEDTKTRAHEHKSKQGHEDTLGEEAGGAAAARQKRLA